RPIFSWNSVSGAESYELELADNPFFANSQAKKPLMNTVWAWDKDLEYSTTYYFRVRAISGKNVSDWVQSVFTTMDKPAPPAPTVAPAPTIPTITIAPPAPVKKFFDPQSGQYFDNEADLRAYQQTHPPALPPATPGYIWAVIIIAAVLVIAVIVLIVRTRRAA
ncbi:MAG: fibronectin type III domain-containing protein, partial [Dehalococcoidia bacterium]|nr:fibronectin type III domain-containing protein [Dehalococcoidia bacterium]